METIILRYLLFGAKLQPDGWDVCLLKTMALTLIRGIIRNTVIIHDATRRV